MRPALRYVGIALAVLAGCLVLVVAVKTILYAAAHLGELIAEFAAFAAAAVVFCIVWILSIGVIVIGFLAVLGLVFWTGQQVISQMEAIGEKLRKLVSVELASGAVDAASLAFLAALVALVAFTATGDFLDHMRLTSLMAAFAITIAACKVLLFFHRAWLTWLGWITSCLLMIVMAYLITSRLGLWGQGVAAMTKSLAIHWDHFGPGKRVTLGVLVILTSIVVVFPPWDLLRPFQRAWGAIARK